MKQVVTEELAKKYSFFTEDENLNPDEFYLFEDVSNEDTTKMDRLQELKNKTYNTESEKVEMAQLLSDLQDCMLSSEDWSKLVCSVYSMQIYMRDEIVIFIKDKQEEFNSLLDEFKFIGIWDNITTYKKGNQVTYGGFGFQSRNDNNLGNEPNIEVTMDDYWVKYTLKGDKGEPSLNIYCKGQYNASTIYNLSTGDACVYNGLLYYVLAEGVQGIVPTNTTKWKVVEESVVSDTQPSNTNVIWFNSINNTINKYIKGQWVSITLDGKTAKGNLGTEEKKDLAVAITEVNTKVVNMSTDVNNIKIKQYKFTEDSKGRLLYNNKNVGVTTASELPITTISGLNASNVQQMGQQLFTFANDGKNAIASVVGNVNSGSTFTQIKNEIQNDKNVLASKLSSKGVSANGNEVLSSLVNKVGNIKTGIEGGTGNYKTFYSYEMGEAPLNPTKIFNRNIDVIIVNYYYYTENPQYKSRYHRGTYNYRFDYEQNCYYLQYSYFRRANDQYEYHHDPGVYYTYMGDNWWGKEGQKMIQRNNVNNSVTVYIPNTQYNYGGQYTVYYY